MYLLANQTQKSQHGVHSTDHEAARLSKGTHHTEYAVALRETDTRARLAGLAADHPETVGITPHADRAAGRRGVPQAMAIISHARLLLADLAAVLRPADATKTVAVAVIDPPVSIKVIHKAETAILAALEVVRRVVS
jgi:hypothetical protein